MTATYDLFQHDWSSPFRLESSWRTAIHEGSEDLGEERIQLWDRPQRVLYARWLGATRGEASRALFQLLRSGEGHIRVPLFCDLSATTASSSGTTINCPTANRRFAAGGLVAIHQAAGRRATNVQYRTIASVGASSITVTSALTGSYPAGSLVYPVVTAELELSGLSDFQASRLCVVEAPFRELHGSSAIAALTNGLEVLAEFPSATCESLERNVFNLEPDWTSSVAGGFVRPGEDFPRGRGRQVYARGERPLWRAEMGFLLTPRVTAWKVVKFLDSMRGSTGVCWFPFPGDLWTPVAYSASYVEIDPAGNLEDLQELVSHVAVEFTDGSFAVRRISSVALVGSAWRITPTESFPAGTLSEVRKISPCALARLDADAHEEEWLSTEVLRIRFAVREVVAEAAVASVSDPETCP